MNNIIWGKHRCKEKAKPPPKGIRDEFRMTVALRGFSSIKYRSSLKLKDQQAKMFDFFHEKKTNHPSQLKLICEGVNRYSDLYDESHAQVLSRNNSQVRSFSQKIEWSMETTQNYLVGYDIL